MDDDELMTIGRFARLTGLSVGTLRHYDEVGLLCPARVDPASGYRQYGRDQAERARQIRMLRWDGLPIEEIRQVIDDPSAASARDVLARPRHDGDGMPRCSAVRDPSGNWIRLYQA